MRIKNVIFDMGKVMVDYQPDLSTRQLTDDEEIIREIHNTLYCSSEWIWMDMGVMSEEQAMGQILPRLSSDRVREIARKSFENWDRYNLLPRRDMGELVRELKARGMGIYLLSNVGLRFARNAARYIPEAELFDGMVFSSVEKLLKPQREIYECILSRYGLDPAESVFIDDSAANIESAGAAGLDGYVFADGDIGKLKKWLEEKMGEEQE